MGLRTDRTILRTQLATIEAQETEIGTYNRRIDALVSEIRDVIISENVENLADAVNDLRDHMGAMGYDGNLNGAKNRISSEIAVISAAIRAQQAAAKAMKDAAK